MIFNGEMVRAILDGGKTQTRRLVKVPHIDRDAMCELSGNELAGELSAGNYRNSPHGKPGDRIWVRETWARYNIDQDSHDMAYRATPPADWPEEGRWRPSIHMPRWASRLTLEITDVRVEKLDKISEEDAIAEGMQGVICPCCKDDPDYSTTQYDPDTLAAVDEIQCQSCSSNRSNFFSLWDSIYGEGNHCMGDWVWVIEFKVAPNVPANSTGSDLR